MRQDFENYKNELANEIMRVGEEAFVKKTIESNRILIYWNEKKYEESLYLLAVIDYLSRVHVISPYGGYKRLRKEKFDKMLFPTSVLLMDKLDPNGNWKEKAIQNALPEFLRHNIIEGEFRKWMN